MPSVTSTDTDTVLEINHHLVHLNTAHQRLVGNADFLGNIIHHQTVHLSQINNNSNGSLLQHNGGHSTTPILPGHNQGGGSLDETEEESLIVVYALFLPLLAALVFILIVALYVRRMRRSTSEHSLTSQKPSVPSEMEYQRQLQQQSTATRHQYDNPGIEFSSLNFATKAQQAQEMTFSYPPRSRAIPTHHYHSRHDCDIDRIRASSSVPSLHGSSSFLSDSSHNQNHSKNPKKMGGRIVSMMNISKRMKEHSAEKHRFNIYTVPIETREQLKQIYVY